MGVCATLIWHLAISETRGQRGNRKLAHWTLLHSLQFLPPVDFFTQPTQYFLTKFIFCAFNWSDIQSMCFHANILPTELHNPAPILLMPILPHPGCRTIKQTWLKCDASWMPLIPVHVFSLLSLRWGKLGVAICCLCERKPEKPIYVFCHGLAVQQP